MCWRQENYILMLKEKSYSYRSIHTKIYIITADLDRAHL